MRISVQMSAAEVAALDEWRVSRKITSRSEAIRQFVKYGIYKSEHQMNTGSDGYIFEPPKLSR